MSTERADRVYSLHYDYDPQRQQTPLTLQIFRTREKQVLATVRCGFKCLQPPEEVDAVLKKINVSPEDPTVAKLYRPLTAPLLTQCTVAKKDLEFVRDFFRQYGGDVLGRCIQFNVVEA